MHAENVGRVAEVAGGGLGARAGGAIGTRGRLILLALFLVPTLPVVPVLMQVVPGARLLAPVHLVVHALPLWATAMIDVQFLDGGEVTPNLIPLWSTLTGVMLWPLAALAIWPGLWQSRGWRRGIGVYGVVAALSTCGAAWWVFANLGRFF
jgi:hypothetical protein